MLWISFLNTCNEVVSNKNGKQCVPTSPLSPVYQGKNVLCILAEIQKGVQVRRELVYCSENYLLYSKCILDDFNKLAQLIRS